MDGMTSLTPQLNETSWLYLFQCPCGKTNLLITLNPPHVDGRVVYVCQKCGRRFMTKFTDEDVKDSSGTKVQAVRLVEKILLERKPV